MGNQLSIKRRTERHHQTQCTSPTGDALPPKQLPATQITNSFSSASSSSSPELLRPNSGKSAVASLKLIRKSLQLSDSQVDQRITEQLRLEEVAQEFRLNVFLTGEKDSGRSAIFKEMVRAFTSTFQLDDDAVQIALHAARGKIIGDIVTLCRHNAVLKAEHSEYGLSGELQPICDAFSGGIIHSNNAWSKEVANDMQTLWLSPPMQLTFRVALAADLLDSSSHYFLSRISEFADVDYDLSVTEYGEIQDLVAGAVLQRFEIDTRCGLFKFNLMQMNQQVSTPRRWMPLLDNVHVVVYVIDLATYGSQADWWTHTRDQFAAVCNNRAFKGIDCAVMLNHAAQFEAQVVDKPLPDNFGVLEEEYEEEKKKKNSMSAEERVVSVLETMYKRNDASGARKVHFHRMHAQVSAHEIASVLQQLQSDIVSNTMKRMGYVM